MPKGQLLSLALESVIAVVVIAMYLGGGASSPPVDVQPSVTVEMPAGTLTVTKFSHETDDQWFARVLALADKAPK